MIDDLSHREVKQLPQVHPAKEGSRLGLWHQPLLESDRE